MPVHSLRSVVAAHLKVSYLDSILRFKRSRSCSVGRDLVYPSLHFLRRGHSHWHSSFQGEPSICVRSRGSLTVVYLQQSAAQQESDSHHFLPVPGSHSAAVTCNAKDTWWSVYLAVTFSMAAVAAP